MRDLWDVDPQRVDEGDARELALEVRRVRNSDIASGVGLAVWMERLRTMALRQYEGLDLSSL
jgi:hypothetical protein